MRLNLFLATVFVISGCGEESYGPPDPVNTVPACSAEKTQALHPDEEVLDWAQMEPDATEATVLIATDEDNPADQVYILSDALEATTCVGVFTGSREFTDTDGAVLVRGLIFDGYLLQQSTADEKPDFLGFYGILFLGDRAQMRVLETSGDSMLPECIAFPALRLAEERNANGFWDADVGLAACNFGEFYLLNTPPRLLSITVVLVEDARAKVYVSVDDEGLSALYGLRFRVDGLRTDGSEDMGLPTVVDDPSEERPLLEVTAATAVLDSIRVTVFDPYGEEDSLIVPLTDGATAFPIPSD